MVTFVGEANMLVRLNPPIGNIKHIRFDAKGEFNTENEHMIQRFHHRFDSRPSDNEPTEEMTDDIEFQYHGQQNVKQYHCNQCEFASENKGVLLAHKKSEHPKEG